MSTIITDYGLDAFAKAAQTLPTNYEIPPEDIDRLLDSALLFMAKKPEFNPNDTIEFKGKPITIIDALGLISPHVDRIRLDSIKMFEKFFSHSTDPESFLREFNSGTEEARKVMQYIGIFPVEAINVRTELAHPALMRLRASQSPDNKGAFSLVNAIIGEHVLVTLKGPNLPPISQDRIASEFKDSFPQIDQLARNIIAGQETMPKSTPMN